MSVFPQHLFKPDPLPEAGPEDKKKALHDGTTPVTEISVLAMFRNNGPYLKDFLFKQLECWEATYDATFSYYFIENDSTDDTRDLLKAWFSGKKGRLILGKLAKQYVNKGENYDRLYTLSSLRNSLVDAITPLNSQWTVFLDSHIFFRCNVLDRMLNDLKPSTKNIGMVTAYTKQVYTNGQLKRMGINVRFPEPQSDDAFVDLNHMYDTFTFNNAASQNYFPACAFKRCLLCPYIRKPEDNLPLIENNAEENVVYCKSSFNGIALIETRALNHPRVRWSTVSFNHTGDMCTCDHVPFCDRLTTVFGTHVVLVQSIDDVLRMY